MVSDTYVTATWRRATPMLWQLGDGRHLCSINLLTDDTDVVKFRDEGHQCHGNLATGDTDVTKCCDGRHRRCKCWENVVLEQTQNTQQNTAKYRKYRNIPFNTETYQETQHSNNTKNTPLPLQYHKYTTTHHKIPQNTTTNITEKYHTTPKTSTTPIPAFCGIELNVFGILFFVCVVC